MRRFRLSAGRGPGSSEFCFEAVRPPVVQDDVLIGFGVACMLKSRGSE